MERNVDLLKNRKSKVLVFLVTCILYSGKMVVVLVGMSIALCISYNEVLGDGQIHSYHPWLKNITNMIIIHALSQNLCALLFPTVLEPNPLDHRKTRALWVNVAVSFGIMM